MARSSAVKTTLVVGVGNTLLQNDGVGVHVIEKLKAEQDIDSRLEIIDGGMIDFTLLPKIENADTVIVVDGAEIGAQPGSMRVFRNREVDRLLSRRSRHAHEAALQDLFAAAAIRGRLPRERILIAIQPACTVSGLTPSAVVRATTPVACGTIGFLTRPRHGA